MKDIQGDDNYRQKKAHSRRWQWDLKHIQEYDNDNNKNE